MGRVDAGVDHADADAGAAEGVAVGAGEGLVAPRRRGWPGWTWCRRTRSAGCPRGRSRPAGARAAVICALVPRATTTPILSKLPVLVMPVAVTARLAAARLLPCTSTVVLLAAGQAGQPAGQEVLDGREHRRRLGGALDCGDECCGRDQRLRRGSARDGAWVTSRAGCEWFDDILNGERAPSGHAPPRDSVQTWSRPRALALGCGHGLPGARFRPPTDAAVASAPSWRRRSGATPRSSAGRPGGST